MFLQILIFACIFLSGFMIMNIISTEFSLGQKIGLSMPLGFGLSTVIMLLANFLRVKFSIELIFSLSLLIVAFVGIIVLRKKKLASIVNLNFKRFRNLQYLNLSWIFLVLVLCYIVYGITAKALFWPPAAYDSVAGYDYMAKVVAAEGNFNNSIFDQANPTSSIRHSYPPFVPGSYAIAYMLGFQSSKISVVLIFVSLIIYFWSLLRKYTSETAAIFFTLLMTSVPEFLAMSALSLTNVPQTLFASSGLLALFEYHKESRKQYLILGTVLLGLNVWTRSDGIIFIAGGGVMLLYHFISKKKFEWKSLSIYSIFSMLPFIVWQLFMKINIKGIYSNSDVFVKHLFWDGEKMSELMSLIWNIISSIQLYGVVFTLFGIILLLNFKFLRKDKPILLIGIFSSFLLYSFLYYQMDNVGDNFGYRISSMINSSFKRGMFPFIPVICFYMGSTTVITRLFKWIYKPLIKSSEN